jgi:hypothetical protein
VMRSKTGTVRFIEARHRFDRLSRITGAYAHVAGSAPPPPLSGSRPDITKPSSQSS